jgi:hypothetical protein
MPRLLQGARRRIAGHRFRSRRALLEPASAEPRLLVAAVTTALLVAALVILAAAVLDGSTPASATPHRVSHGHLAEAAGPFAVITANVTRNDAAGSAL